MRNKWIFVLSGILLVFALFISNPSAVTAKAPESIKIASVLSLTGPYAPLGNQIKMVYQIYVDKVNSGGGLFIKKFNKKIPIEHKILDDESDGLKTILQLEVANEWGAVVNLGGIGCTSFEVGTVVAQKNKMVWILFTGITLVAAVLGDINLAANNGLYAVLSGEQIKLNSTVHDTMVSDC